MNTLLRSLQSLLLMVNTGQEVEKPIRETLVNITCQTDQGHVSLRRIARFCEKCPKHGKRKRAIVRNLKFSQVSGVKQIVLSFPLEQL